MATRLRAILTNTPTLALAVFVVVAVFPQLGVGVYWQRQVVVIAIYTLLVSGLNLSFGYAGELALGQVAVFAAGAYGAAILHNWGQDELLVHFAVALAIAAAVGLVSGIPGLRLGHWSLAIVSFFLVLLVPSVTTMFKEQTGGAAGLPGIFGPTLLGRPLGPGGFYLTAIVVTLIWMVIYRNLIVSRFGTFLQILHESTTLVESLGGSVYRLKVQAYVIGALPAGLAGVLYTYLTGFIHPGAFTFALVVTLLAASVVGGSNSVWGAPVGAAVLVLGPLQLAAFEAYSVAFYGVLLILVGTLFSGGLAHLGRRLQRRMAPPTLASSGAVDRAGEGDAEAVLSIPGERLEVSNVEKRFSGIQALAGASLTVEPGTITAVIGPNGAGKTTLLNTISGFIRPDGGHVSLGGERLTGLAAHRVSLLGVGRTFQAPVVPGGMTVQRVVETGRLRHGRIGFLSALLRLPHHYRVRAEDRVASAAALRFAGLEDLGAEAAESLPLGTRRLLEVVRSVAGAPSVLLLDEPAAGLDDEALAELTTLMRRARDAGGTVVLVEHNVPFVMEVADHVFVMDLGTVIASGPPDVIRDDQRVIDTYLGQRAASIDDPQRASQDPPQAASSTDQQSRPVTPDGKRDPKVAK